ncbi:hypothetical protein HK096_004951, partial [Nowakowskiella sp. JEL0078]
TFAVGDEDWLQTQNLTTHLPNRIPWKFQDHNVGPFMVLAADVTSLTYQLELPYDWKIYDKFHSSVLKHAVHNDDERFPGRTFPHPEPIVVDDFGYHFTEAEVKSHHAHGCRFEYLVC